MIFFCDIEADGLLDTITKVHCMSVLREDGCLSRYVGHEQIALGLASMSELGGTQVWHNGIGYDLVALFKVMGYKTPESILIRDTLIMSSLVVPDIGGHSLEDWGERINEPKTDYRAAYIEWRQSLDENYRYQEDDEWLEFNEIMGAYCDQDVRVLAKVYSNLLHRMGVYEKECRGVSWDKALWMEHEFAKQFAMQSYVGVYVDKPHALSFKSQLEGEMLTIVGEVEPMLPTRPGTKGQLQEARPPKRCFNADGQPSLPARKWFDEIRYMDGLAVLVPEDEQLVAWEGLKYGKWHGLPTPMDEDGLSRVPLRTEFPMKLADQAALKAWLMDMGWIPTMWSYKKQADENGKLRIVRSGDGQPVPAQPKFHDKGELCPNLEGLRTEFPHVAKVVRWMVLRHRLGLVNGALECIRPDGTAAASGHPLGTPTSRVRHTRPVCNIPKADPTVVYGKECRALFTARPGRVLSGTDASGLELRCLANRIGSQAIIDMILHGKKEDGTEIHSFLLKACHPLVPDRNTSKSVCYGWLYGASDKKLGETAGHGANAESVGAEIRKRLVNAIDGLPGLMKKVEAAAKRGWIVALDGRRIAIRSKHAALNTLLQSDGSLAVKWATVLANKRMRAIKLDAYQVIHYHDEVQHDCKDEDTGRMAGSIFVGALKHVGKFFKFKIALDGETSIGHSWADTH
jgi:hypothetical protein